MQRTADLSRLPRDTGERRDLTVGRDFAAGNFCDDGIDAGVRRHFFTFLPSFLFILCGAPLVEATHGDRKVTAPLSGITAAAVGVVVNLAVFFAWHVLRPAGTDAAPFASHQLGRDRPKRALPAPAQARESPAGLPMLQYLLRISVELPILRTS